MKPICALLLALGVCRASVIPLQAQTVISASQVRVQDELGQYHFAHAGGPNARSETRTADGITRGDYSYVDGNGLVQSAAYVSDPVNGFRVAATNLPVGPAVPAAEPQLVAVPAVAGPVPVGVAAVPPPVAVGVAAVPPPVAVGVASVPGAIVATPGLVSAPHTLIPTGPAIVGPVAGGVTIKGAEAGEVQIAGAEARSADPSPAPTPAPEPSSTEAQPSTAAPEVSTASEPSREQTASAEPAPAPVNPFVPVQDTPEVIAARAQHLAAVQETQARDAASGSDEGTESSTGEPTETPETPEPSENPSTEAASSEAPSTPAPVEPAFIPAAQPTVYIGGPLPAVAPVGPVAAVAAPAIARVASIAAPSVAPVAAPVAPIPAFAAPAPIAVGPALALADAAQYRVQDELGQYAFGHVGGPNSREEIRTADGITRGGFAYVDANGLVQSASYVSDPVHGFRVAATNIPVQPAPAYIDDSPEVAQAKAELFQAQAEHIAKL